MSRSMKAGTALRLLCLPLTLSMVTACGRQAEGQATAQPQPKEIRTKESQEIFDDVQAMKNNPSLQPGSNQAGPPIHVNPYPKSAGMAHDEHGHHDMAKH
jgi:hypothetical protein